MTYWEGLVLGLVQGLTEFLPISSSGHLVLAEAALGLSTPGVLVEVTVHVATLAAVLVVYRQRLVGLLAGALRRDIQAWKAIGLLALASLPAGIVGVGLGQMIERAFDSLLVVGVGFVITGSLLWSSRGAVQAGERGLPGWLGAVGVGLAQALAVLPGISRSGSTIVAALWTGVSPVKAAEFSFLLAIPAIGGAAVLELGDATRGIATMGAGPLAVSFAAALVSGVAAIRLLVAVLGSRAFHRFAPYCWILGILTVIWALER